MLCRQIELHMLFHRRENAEIALKPHGVVVADIILNHIYNYVDMNRVESAVEFIKNRLAEAGYYISPEVKTIWTVSDHPTKEDMDRYLGNIALLRSVLPVYPTTPKAPTTQKKMDYLVAKLLPP